MDEIWKDIEGYEGKYQVSNLGRIRSLISRHGKRPRPLILKQTPTHAGYLHLALYKNGVPETCLAHRLVAEAFVPNPENKPEVNHKDLDKANNIYTNLEWMTCRENIIHGYANGAEHKAKGEVNGHSKLTEKDVLSIREMYKSGEYSQYDLADEFNVGQHCISRVVNKKRWKHI